MTVTTSSLVLAFTSDNLEPIIVILFILLFLISLVIVIALPFITQAFWLFDCFLFNFQSLHFFIHALQCFILLQIPLLELRIKSQKCRCHSPYALRVIFH